MPYPDLLIGPDADPQGMTLREIQAAKLEEYAKRHEEKKCKHGEKMHAGGEG